MHLAGSPVKKTGVYGDLRQSGCDLIVPLRDLGAGIGSRRHPAPSVLLPEQGFRERLERLSVPPKKCSEALDKLEKIKARTRLVNATDLMKRELAPIRWALRETIPTGLSILIGRPKIGKSSFTLGIATAIASGCVALGSIGTERGDVLYLALGTFFIQEKLVELITDFFENNIFRQNSKIALNIFPFQPIINVFE